MSLTAEQEAVVRSRARRLAVEARAGSGKTTVLARYAAARQEQPMLYLAFNRSVAQEAASKFPRNVVCRTAHALAYPKAAALFGDAVKRKVGTTFPSAVARRCGANVMVAAAALETLARWFVSSDEHLSSAHVPSAYVLRGTSRDKTLNVARWVLAQMLDPADTEIRAPHDLYLKMWALERPRLTRYSVLLVDEAQDLSPVVAAVLAEQTVPTVWVGDRHQSLYAFRGAMDALGCLHADERLHLSTSFRFGEGIASLASRLLADFKRDTRAIVGAGSPRHSMMSINEARSYAYIARTNAALFSAAVAALATKRPLVFIGGADGCRLDRILDVHHLAAGQRALVRDPYLRSFEGLDQLAEAACAAVDRELKFLRTVVSAHGAALPRLIAAIRERSVDERRAASAGQEPIFLASCHRAKGLEWEQVLMADDFEELLDEHGRPKPGDWLDPQEINALYVAVTRARARLRVCAQIDRWLQASAEGRAAGGGSGQVAAAGL